MHAIRAIATTYCRANHATATAVGRPLRCYGGARPAHSPHQFPADCTAPKPPTAKTAENAATQRRVDIGGAQRCHCQQPAAAAAAGQFGSTSVPLAPALSIALAKAAPTAASASPSPLSTSSGAAVAAQLRTSLPLVISSSSSCLFASACHTSLSSAATSSTVEQQLFDNDFTALASVHRCSPPVAATQRSAFRNCCRPYSILAGASLTPLPRRCSSSCSVVPLRSLHTGAAAMVWVSDFDLDPEVRKVPRWG